MVNENARLTVKARLPLFFAFRNCKLGNNPAQEKVLRLKNAGVKQQIFISIVSGLMKEIAEILRLDDVSELTMHLLRGLDADSRISPRFMRERILRGNPPLISVSAFYGSVNCFNTLLQHGASVDLVDTWKRGTIHFAAMGPSAEIIKSLRIAVQFWDVKDAEGNGCIHHALLNNRGCHLYWLWVVASCDLEEKNSIGMTPLHYAAMAQDIESIKFLCENGCDPNAKNGVPPCFIVESLFHSCNTSPYCRLET